WLVMIDIFLPLKKFIVIPAKTGIIVIPAKAGIIVIPAKAGIIVIPAKAGIQEIYQFWIHTEAEMTERIWISAYAGMTKCPAAARNDDIVSTSFKNC
ncbi:MAG: hypothetical protein KKH06_04955, partial [Gammaproteobacteria bacterium]|nr:hypothetical protein [Gammaproteobacteria bacterium]